MFLVNFLDVNSCCLLAIVETYFFKETKVSTFIVVVDTTMKQFDTMMLSHLIDTLHKKYQNQINKSPNLNLLYTAKNITDLFFEEPYIMLKILNDK